MSLWKTHTALHVLFSGLLIATGVFTFGNQAFAYATDGLLVSTNLLSGEGGGARRIISVTYHASSIPANTSLRMSFSRTGTGTAWYSASGALYGWNTLSEGTHTISFTVSDWKSTSKFYYKVYFLSDGVATPVMDSIRLDFDSLINQYDTYNSTGSLVSTNLLSGQTAQSIDSFVTTVSARPSNTSIAVQFSQDSTTWYNAAGSQNGSNTLSEGVNTTDLSGLGWSGSSFYYRINLSSSGASTPVLEDVALSYTPDTTPPAAPGTPDLTSGSDTGTSSTDDITKNTTPTFTISCESGATVTLLSGATTLGSDTCSSSTVSITSSTLSNGIYSITAKQTDASSNVSGESAALSLTIDTTAPVLAEVTPVPTPTNNTTPSYTFSATEAGTIAYGGDCSSATTSATSGNNAITFNTLAEGTHSNCTIAVTDTAGNVSSTLNVTSFTIDTTAPAAPGTPDLIDASDTGESNTDNVTSDTTPTLTATCETAATVTLYSGSTVLGTGACASSTVSITSSTLTDATYSLKAKQRDVAGNFSATGAALNVTIDATAPTASTLSPADDVIDVATTASLVLTFTEAITKAGTGTVTIRKSSDDSVVEIISVTGSLVTGSGTTQITINPTADLANSTVYYIQIASTAFPDSAGNRFAGISSSTAWNFTTVAAPSVPSSSSSSAQATGGGGGGGGGHRGSTESMQKQIQAAYAMMLARFEGVKSESDHLFVEQEEKQIDLAAASREQRITERITAHKATLVRLDQEQEDLRRQYALLREERLQIALQRNEQERVNEQAALLAQQDALNKEREKNQKLREQRIAEQQKSSSPTNQQTLAGIAERRNRLFASIDSTPVLYKDVVMDSWYAPYVSYMIEERIATGYADEQGKLKGEFGVANPITRAELLKMALEAAGAKLEGGSPRNTTAKGTWASSYVFTAESLHLSIFASTVDVNAPATRGEVVQTLLEIFKFMIPKTPASFADVPASHPYSQAIGLAAYSGFVEGDVGPDGTPLNRFRPDAAINRAEVSKVIALMREVMR